MIDTKEYRERLSEKRLNNEFREKERFFKLEPIESSLSFNRKIANIKTLDQIKEMCSNFEITESVTPNPPNRFSLSKGTKKKLYEQVANEIGIIVSPKLKYIVSELKKRIKSLPLKYESYVSPNRFHSRQDAIEKYCQREYIDKSVEKIKANEFSSIPRLKSPTSHLISHIKSHYNVRKANSTEKIRYNIYQLKNIEHSQLTKKQKYLEETIKIKEIKERKKLIEIEKRENRLLKLNQKFRLFEWRMIKEDVQCVKKAWVMLCIISGVSLVLLLKGRIKKLLKSRWEVFLRKFVVISKFLAKFMIRLKAIRKRLIEKKLKKFWPALEEYVRRVNFDYKKFMQNFIEEFHELPPISKLMIKVKFSAIKLQRTFRGFLKVKSARIETLRILWDKLYLKYVKSKPEKTAALERLGRIKNKIIDTHLEGYVKKTLKFFLNKKRRYLANKDTSLPPPALILYTKHPVIIDMIIFTLKSKEKLIKKQKMSRYKLEYLNSNSISKSLK